MGLILVAFNERTVTRVCRCCSACLLDVLLLDIVCASFIFIETTLARGSQPGGVNVRCFVGSGTRKTIGQEIFTTTRCAHVLSSDKMT
jgi:hypothetical protein